jgi:hypothetical protein
MKDRIVFADVCAKRFSKLASTLIIYIKQKKRLKEINVKKTLLTRLKRETVFPSFLYIRILRLDNFESIFDEDAFPILYSFLIVFGIRFEIVCEYTSLVFHSSGYFYFPKQFLTFKDPQNLTHNCCIRTTKDFSKEIKSVKAVVFYSLPYLVCFPNYTLRTYNHREYKRTLIYKGGCHHTLDKSGHFKRELARKNQGIIRTTGQKSTNGS